MGFELLGLRVTYASHNNESGYVVHVWQDESTHTTMCVVVFDDGHILEMAATALKAKK